MATWAQTKTQIEKIVGKDAKVPDKPPAIDKAADDITKSQQDFEKARDGMEDQILAYQNALSAYENTVKQFADKLAGNDLGLDKKAADYKKKRAECQKLIDASINNILKIVASTKKGADELDKHMNNLNGYKSPKTPDI